MLTKLEPEPTVLVLQGGVAFPSNRPDFRGWPNGNLFSWSPGALSALNASTGAHFCAEAHQIDTRRRPCPMKPDEKARVRRFAPKTRNGCLTCKRRHTRCDERKPTCFTCERLGIRCMGYVIPKPWLFDPGQPQPPNASVISPPSSEEERERAGSNEAVTLAKVHSTTLPRAFQSIPRGLSSTANEPAVIMEAYLHLATKCPMSWDSLTYQSRKDAMSSLLHPGNGNLTWSPSQGSASSFGPLRYQSFIAFASSALAHFEPRRFPLQLHLKYMHLAVATMRSVIAHNTFVLDDLLHGISKTLLASVIQGDFESARAHLGAAVGIVQQQGGIDMIDGQIAAALRYADLHLATESLRAPAFPLFEASDIRLQIDTPTFPLFFPSTGRLAIDVGSVDRELVRLAHTVRHESAAVREPRFVAGAVGQLLDSAMVLAHGFATSSTTAIGLQELIWVGTHVAETFYLLLKHCPSVLSKQPLGQFKAPAFEVPARTYESVIHLMMWAVLLLCAINETIGSDVTMRMNCIPLLHHDLPFANNVRATLSETIRHGLREWNDKILRARREWREERLGDWEQAIEVAAETEKTQPVHLAPFMRRLFAIRRDRPAASKIIPILGEMANVRRANSTIEEASQHMASPAPELLELSSDAYSCKTNIYPA